MIVLTEQEIELELKSFEPKTTFNCNFCNKTFDVGSKLVAHKSMSHFRSIIQESFSNSFRVQEDSTRKVNSRILGNSRDILGIFLEIFRIFSGYSRKFSEIFRIYLIYIC